ncbi:MAG: twitching motility protein (pilT) [Anaplasma ovis]
MEYLKQLVASSIQHNASHLYCVIGQPPAIKRLGHIEFLQVRKIDQSDIKSILSAVLSAEAQAKFDSDGEVSVNFEFDETHFLNIHVARDISRLESEAKVTIFIRELALPSEDDVPQELVRTAAYVSRGVILLGGAAHHNKNYTIEFLLHKIGTAQKKHILTFGMEAESVPKSDRAIISAYDTSQANFDFIKKQAADIVVFAELNSNLVSVAHSCVTTGMLVIAAIDAVSTACMLERVLSMFPNMESGINFLASHVLGATLQVLLARKPCVYVYDFITFDNKVRETIRSGNIELIENSDIVEKISKLIEENKLTHSDAQPVLAHLVSSTSSQYASNVEDEF